MDYSVIARAGLTQQEFASLINFSRPSTNLWINGRKTPGPRAAHHIKLALAALESAVENGHLPANTVARREKLLASLKAWQRRQVA